jgi:type II secretory pathway pseudopilin PulG
VERKKTGLTIIELLIVLGIIALLVGLLVPSLSAVKKMAKETKQKAQFVTIKLALEAFKNDYGDYPQSGRPVVDYTSGSQALAEALLGWDLLGFHPNSAWRADGLDKQWGPGSYDPAQTRDINGDGVPDTFDERKGPYLELANVGAFRLVDLFGTNAAGPLDPNTFVICDVFGAKKISMANGKIVRAGAPILYYRANTSGKTTRTIYDGFDNIRLVFAKLIADGGEHPFTRSNFFYDYIKNPKRTDRDWPYRPDSYILISAGADGLYGTHDDITNFGN